MVVGEVNPMSLGPMPPPHSHPEEMLLSDRMVVPSSSSPRTLRSPDMPGSSPLPPNGTSSMHAVDPSDMKGPVDSQAI